MAVPHSNFNKSSKKDSAKRTKHNRFARYCRTLLAAGLISSGMLGSLAPALAQGTEAGTEITNTAVGSFQNPNDTAADPIEVTSNEVIVTVAEVAGITVVSSGLPTEAPAADVTNPVATQGDGNINPDEVVYYTFTITNTGNDATQFFLPDAPSDILLNGASGGGTLEGDIEIIAFDANGSTPVDLSTNPVAVPAGGDATGNIAGIGTGSFDPDGSITIRIPIRLDAGLADGDEVRVIFGDTAPNDDTAATQNQALSAGTNDVFTQDNDSTNNGDTLGAPANGEREASATSLAVVGVVPRDYGDLPAPYSSLEAVGGPSHFIRTGTDGNPDLFLGSGVTSEADALIAPNADGTDDAEDNGVSVGSVSLQGLNVIQGQSITLDVSTTGADGRLNVWFDWNADGTFDAGEQVATDLTPTGNAIQIPDVTVPSDATPGDVGVLVRYSSSTGVGPTALGGFGEVETYLINVAASQPALTLVKRVTSVGGTAVTGFVDDPDTTDDNDPNWPVDFLEGSIDTSSAAPGEAIEYTIYFLSSGNDAITNLNICDMVPTNTTYNDAVDSIQLFFNGTTTTFSNTVGNDAGEFNPGLPGPNCPTDNGNGGILVNVVSAPDVVDAATAPGTPNTSFGFVRFQVTVD